MNENDAWRRNEKEVYMKKIRTKTLEERLAHIESCLYDKFGLETWRSD